MTFLIVILSAATAIDGGASNSFNVNDELRGYMVEAAENSPVLLSLHLQWKAALQKLPQVTSLDDPVFTFGYFIQSATGEYKVGLAQKFPWFGTLATRGDVAAAEARAALSAFESERNRLFANVRRLYAEYAFLGQNIETTRSQAEFLEYMEDIVLTKYSVGLAREDELLRIQIAREKLNDRHAQLHARRPVLCALLRELLGRGEGEVLPWPASTELPSEAPSSEVVHARVRAANPDLTSLQHTIDSRRAMVELARKKGYPELTLGLEYVSLGNPETNRPDRPYPSGLYALNRLGRGLSGAAPLDPAVSLIDSYSVGYLNEPMAYPDDLRDNFMISFKVNVPLWRRKVRAGIEEARLKTDAAEMNHRKVELHLSAAATAALEQMRDARRRVDLYRDSLVPKADQTYASLLAAYSAGTGTTFLDLLDSVQTRLEFRLEGLRAARDLRIAAADLDLLMGNTGLE